VPKNNIADQPVPVRAHGNQIAMFPLHPFDDFPSPDAVSQLRLRVNSHRLKLSADFFQIRCVLRNLRAHRVRAMSPRRPPIRHVQQDHPAARDFASLFTCSTIAWSVGVPSSVTRMVLYMAFCLQANLHPPVMTCQADLSESGSPQMSIAAISSALPHPAAAAAIRSSTRHPLARTGEMQQREHRERKFNASTTWLSVSKSFTLLLAAMMTIGRNDRQRPVD